MKSNFSFILCSVLIYVTVCCLYVSAEDTPIEESDGKSDDETCIVQYFKSKGKLPNDYPSAKASTLCRFTMIEVQRILREMIKDNLKKELPNEVDCVMEQFEKNQTMDLFLLVAIIKTTKDQCEQLKGLQNETLEQLKAAATACGLEEDRFMSVYNKMYESKTCLKV